MRGPRIRRPLSVLAACSPLLAACGGVEIVQFDVTLSTGDNGTDSDVMFCYARRHDGDEDCFELDRDDYDDFEQFSVDTYRVQPSSDIPAEDGVEEVRIRLDPTLFGASWKLTGLKIVEVLDSGVERELCSEEGISILLDPGQQYNPAACP